MTKKVFATDNLREMIGHTCRDAEAQFLLHVQAHGNVQGFYYEINGERDEGRSRSGMGQVKNQQTPRDSYGK